MMNKFYTLTQVAHAAINPYDTDIRNKKIIASQYAIPLAELHLFGHKHIPKTIQEFKDNLDLFFRTIRDPSERPDVKVHLLICPIDQGFLNLSISAERQPQPSERFEIEEDFSGLPRASIKDLAISMIDFDEVLEDLMKIAENRKEDVFVREEALRVHSNIYAHATNVFDCIIDWQPFDDRITRIALNTANERLTRMAVNFIDQIKPSRSPSNP